MVKVIQKVKIRLIGFYILLHKKCKLLHLKLGFGFLSFELEESIEQACAERYVTISGKQV